MTERKIEGVPDGWRLVRIGKPKAGEYYIEINGEACEAKLITPTVLQWVFPIIEKIEQPKLYRPFANANEFESHREKWWRFKEDNYNLCRPPASYDDRKYWNWDWKEMFEDAVFADGSPFGVEVTE